MNWDDLRFFLALSREGSLSQAARALGVNHATVARRIRALEDHIGAKLFVKNADGYALTERGVKLMGPAREAEDACLKLQRVATGTENSIEGVVRVASSLMLAEIAVLPAVMQLRERHPGMVVDLIEGKRFVDLTRQEADLALRMTISEQPAGGHDLLVTQLGFVHWALCGAPGMHREDLNDLEFVMLDEDAPSIVGQDWLSRHVVRPRVVMKTNSINSAFLAVRAGLGASFLPRVWAEHAGLEVLSEDMFRLTAFLIVHPDLREQPRVEAMREALLRHCANARIFSHAS